MPSNLPEGHVGITISLPQEMIDRLDEAVAALQLKLLQAGQTRTHVTRTSFIRNLVIRTVAKQK